MSSYPPEEWEVLLDEQFGTMIATETPKPLTAEVYIQISRQATAAGNFRVVLGGADLVLVEVNAAKFLPLEVASNYMLRIQRWPRDIDINANSTCSDWFDLQAAMAEGSIDVCKSDGSPDVHNIFIRNLHQETSWGAIGEAFRWAIAVSANNTLELQFQSLPLPEPYVSTKPLLTGDNIAVVVLGKWPISCPLFDGEYLWGPVPVLFTEQPEELRRAIDADPEAFIPELNKLSAKFLRFERLRISEAKAYAKKPKKGKGDTPFTATPIPRPTPPPEKRPRRDAGPILNTGIFY